MDNLKARTYYNSKYFDKTHNDAQTDAGSTGVIAAQPPEFCCYCDDCTLLHVG